MLAAAGDTFEKSKYTQHKPDIASTLHHSCVTRFEHKRTLQTEHLNANIWHAIAQQLNDTGCLTLFNTKTNRAHSGLSNRPLKLCSSSKCCKCGRHTFYRYIISQRALHSDDMTATMCYALEDDLDFTTFDDVQTMMCVAFSADVLTTVE